MSILPEKRIEHTMIEHDGISHPMANMEAIGFNKCLDLCQQAVDKAVEKVADVKEIAEILPSVQEADEDGYSEDLDYYTAQKISTHIKRAFGKENEE